MHSRASTGPVQAVRQYFAEAERGVLAAYVFGSVARGSAEDSSDVDVAVLLAGDPPRTLDGLRTDLADDLQERIGRPVDLVVLNHAAADLVHRVLRDGILVQERSRAARIAFEVRRRNEYFDLEPVRRRYRRRPSTVSGASAR
jgi:predicted nucleotidyltransferase